MRNDCDITPCKVRRKNPAVLPFGSISGYYWGWGVICGLWQVPRLFLSGLKEGVSWLPIQVNGIKVHKQKGLPEQNGNVVPVISFEQAKGSAPKMIIAQKVWNIDSQGPDTNPKPLFCRNSHEEFGDLDQIQSSNLKILIMIQKVSRNIWCGEIEGIKRVLHFRKIAQHL